MLFDAFVLTCLWRTCIRTVLHLTAFDHDMPTSIAREKSIPALVFQECNDLHVGIDNVHAPHYLRFFVTICVRCGDYSRYFCCKPSKRRIQIGSHHQDAFTSKPSTKYCIQQSLDLRPCGMGKLAKHSAAV